MLSRYSRMSERVQHDEQCSSLHDRWCFRYDEQRSSLHAEGLTDKTIPFSWPDITPIDRTNQEAAFHDIAVPLTHSLQGTITQKQYKYQDLSFQVKQHWQLNKIFVIQLVLSATGVIPNMLNQSLTTLNLLPCLLFRVRACTHSLSLTLSRVHTYKNK